MQPRRRDQHPALSPAEITVLDNLKTELFAKVGDGFVVVLDEQRDAFDTLTSHRLNLDDGHRSAMGHSRRFLRAPATSGYPPKLTMKADLSDRRPWADDSRLGAPLIA